MSALADSNFDNGPVTRPLPNYIIVNDAPKLDLDTYISNYDGLTRLDRLQTIGASSRYLGVDALRMAINEAKQGRNITKYLELLEAARFAKAPAELTTEDQDWTDRIARRVKAETDRLEAELKGYKNNLIKESIRMGNEELGGFYYSTGDYAAAFKAYSRMREYCTTPKHICEMTLKLILTAIVQENWMHVQSNTFKLSALGLRADDADKVTPLIDPLRGLCALVGSQYAEAAGFFLSTDAAYATSESVAGICFPRAVLSPNDIAIYGALLSLATMSRTDLQLHVLENAAFRTYLELEPHLRRAVADFVSGKYTSVLATLEAYRGDYLLDHYLQRHVGAIYDMIRRKSMVAYFAAFSRVSVATMAAAFGKETQAMLEELVEMVRDGSLEDARVDVVEGMLVARSADRRVEVGQRALDAARATEKELRLKLWRINMIEAGLVLTAPKGEGAERGFGGGGGGGTGSRGMEMRSGGKGKWGDRFRR